MKDSNNTNKNGDDNINIDDDAQAERLKNRRRMAWISLCSMLIVTAFLVFHVDAEKVKSLEEVITWFYISMASVVGAYMGFETIWDTTKKK